MKLQRKTYRRSLPAVLLAASAVAMVVPAAAVSTTAERPGEVQRVLDRAVAVGKVPGILAEVRDGSRRWLGTAGVADSETGRKRRPADRFRIGSITKTFTATVMLRLEADHLLSLDDTVEKWLPGVVHGNGHDGNRITIRQLLGHTSGVYSYLQDPDMVRRYDTAEFLDHRFDHWSPDQLVRIAMKHPPHFTPGTDWRYSNSNYILAGMIIERVTRRTLADEIERQIARPLGLIATYLPRGDDPSIRGPHSRHYTTLNVLGPDAKAYDVTELNTSAGWAAGGMVSTTRDLSKFMGALLAGRLLPPAQQREMFTTVPTRAWIENTTYGLGMSSVKLSCGSTVWGMGGALNTSWSSVYGTRDGERMVATNVNGDWADGGWRNPIDIFTDVLEAEFCQRS